MLIFIRTRESTGWTSLNNGVCEKKKIKAAAPFLWGPFAYKHRFSPFPIFFFFVKRIIHKNVNSAPDAIFFFSATKNPFLPDA